MAKISDEIREWCDIRASNEVAFIDKYDCDKLRALADRIDNEMVELPRDMDGLPIHAGDTVYLEDGRKADVSCVHIARNSTSIDFETCDDGRIFFSIESKHFAHERPDSWERIADDIEESKGTVLISENTLDGWAYRIRRLAEKEDKR